MWAAARHVGRALKLDPINPEILGSAAIIAEDLGRLNEAIALKEHVVARDPVNAHRLAESPHNSGLSCIQALL